MPLELKTFTPLSQAQINQIIANAGALVPQVATAVKAAREGNAEYQNLISGYAAAADKRQFIEANQQRIAEFLNDCGLMGYVGEKNAVKGGKKIELGAGNFVIGAEGIGVILAYLKEKHPTAHEVVSVKNADLITDEGSRKHSNIFLEQSATHDRAVISSLKAQLAADLLEAKEKSQALNKTYVVETFGTTGGNHIVSLTVRKKVGENNPLVHLFDPSPSLLRNGLEATQNSIANGWNAQLQINATVKKAFAEAGLTFDSEKYFNNSEPQQHRGFIYCGTFSYEAAYRIAGLDRAGHEALLGLQPDGTVPEGYKYPSLFGGRTEVGCKNAAGATVPVSVAQIIADGGYIKNPVLGLQAQEVVLTHFVDPALTSRQDELAGINHVRKEGREVETEHDHVRRYQSQKQGAEGFNLMTDQKALRQKIGHLFEIVSNPEFLNRANGQQMIPNPFVDYSPYSPKYSAAEAPSVETEKLVNAFAKILPPPFSGVNCSKYEQEVCKITTYIGGISGVKLVNFAERNSLANSLRLVNFGPNLEGVDPALSEVFKFTVEVPRERFGEITNALSSQAKHIPKDHLFTPRPTATVFEQRQLAPVQNQQNEVSH